MQPTPFGHALTLAWADGGLSRQGARLLDNFQRQLGLTDTERARIEEPYLEADVAGRDRAGFGRGAESLGRWLGALSWLDEPNAVDNMRAMGSMALELGLSPLQWQDGHAWSEQLGMGTSFAEGVWREAGGQMDSIPRALLPMAEILGFFDQPDVEPPTSTPSAGLAPTGPAPAGVIEAISAPPPRPERIAEEPALPVDAVPAGGDQPPIEGEAPPVPPAISLAPAFLPQVVDCRLPWMGALDGGRFASGTGWWWRDGIAGTAGGHEADLTIDAAVFEHYLGVILETGQAEGGLRPGEVRWPVGGTVITIDATSGNLALQKGRVLLSLLVDVGDEAGFVEPWVSVSFDGDDLIKVEPPPSQLDPGWYPLHDFLGELLVQTLTGFPNQLLRGLRLDSELVEIRTVGDSVTYTLTA